MTESERSVSKVDPSSLQSNPLTHNELTLGVEEVEAEEDESNEQFVARMWPSAAQTRLRETDGNAEVESAAMARLRRDSRRSMLVRVMVVLESEASQWTQVRPGAEVLAMVVEEREAFPRKKTRRPREAGMSE